MGWYASRRHSEDLTVSTIVSGVATKIQTLIAERARRYRYRQMHYLRSIAKKPWLNTPSIWMPKHAAVVWSKKGYLT
jgi:hypothetical protein